MGARNRAMPSTHVSLHYHIIFWTKDRRRIIAEPWHAALHAYIGGIIRDIDAVARSIGGPGDHVHVLLGLKATHTFRTPELARGNGRIDEIRLSLNSRGAAEGCSHGCRPWFAFLAGH